MASGRTGSDNWLEAEAFKNPRMLVFNTSKTFRDQSSGPTFLLTDMIRKAQNLKTCIRSHTKLVLGLGCEPKTSRCV